MSSPLELTPAKKATHQKSSKKRQAYSHLPLTGEERSANGRRPGRNLIHWGRPRMAEKLLLHIQYECLRHGVNLPWDHIAHRLNPGSSGPAIEQHLARLRKTLIQEGHLVPPPPTRPGGNVKAVHYNVRGYTRRHREPGHDINEVREVTFTDHWVEPKFNLPDAPQARLNYSEETLKRSPAPSEPEDEKEHTPGSKSTPRSTSAKRLKHCESPVDFEKEDYGEADVDEFASGMPPRKTVPPEAVLRHKLGTPSTQQSNSPMLQRKIVYHAGQVMGNYSPYLQNPRLFSYAGPNPATTASNHSPVRRGLVGRLPTYSEHIASCDWVNYIPAQSCPKDQMHWALRWPSSSSIAQVHRDKTVAKQTSAGTAALPKSKKDLDEMTVGGKEKSM